jgi:hypothetical protein
LLDRAVARPALSDWRCSCRTDEQMEQIIKFSKGIHFFKYITNAQVRAAAAA